MFDTNSDYNINQIYYGETFSSYSSDYGVFVLGGEPKKGGRDVLILAIMCTDGKTSWPTATSVMDIEDFFDENPYLAVQDRDILGALQIIETGDLVVSLFRDGKDGSRIESSHIIALPRETSLRG